MFFHRLSVKGTLVVIVGPSINEVIINLREQNSLIKLISLNNVKIN